LLKEIEWGTLVLDEAQNVKNSASKTAAAVRGISAKWKLALTGTPMENHLGELWSIFHTIAPGVLGSWEQFRRRFAGPIEERAKS
jgi:SNF2 family DNA or RNA helicase